MSALRPTSEKARRCLVTGISDASSLATDIARQLLREDVQVVCSGLGPTSHHRDLSERARDHLSSQFESFRKTVETELGTDSVAIACDLGLDASVREMAAELAARGLVLDGLVHSVARDRTLTRGGSRALLDVSREDFLDCLDVSAYSLIRLVRTLLEEEALAPGASIVSLSYIGAERVVSHPYDNVAVAKAALERITVGLAHELGRSHGIRVNAVRFSPYSATRAGGAIPGLHEAEQACGSAAALGNASPGDLALEVAHLLRPGHAITGEIRNVDGGLQILANAGPRS
ncbi:MAG: SDR family oxidoreductase [Myxococcota bacterium]|nr:SDR family oxidoreductase [Myxococcota bacterium]